MEREASVGRVHHWMVVLGARRTQVSATAYLVRTGQTAPDEATDFPAFVDESASIMRTLQEARKPRWIRALRVSNGCDGGAEVDL
jgi:hypothetical protein